MSRKLLLEDAHGQREFLLVGTLTVGRDPRCEISANDPLLSRQHAEFVETASGVLVRDLHSQNGIRVNDVAVKEAALRSGDIVQIARMQLRYLEEASTQPGAAAGAGAGTDASTAEDDKTRVLQSPHVPQRAARREGAIAASPASAAHAPGAAAPPPAVSTPAASVGSAASPAAAGSGAGAGSAGAAAPEALAASGSAGPSAAWSPAPVVDEGGADDASRADAARSPSEDDAAAPRPADDDDRTRVVAMPVAAMRAPHAHDQRASGAAAAVPAGNDRAVASGVAAPAVSSAAAAEARGKAGNAGVGAAARGAGTPMASAAAPASAASPDADAAPPVTATVRTPRGTWGGRVLLRVLMLGLLCSLASAVPLMMWHQQQVRALALSRATTLANWFAAEAALALERGQDAGPAVDAVTAEAGIVAARVLSPEGHVTAPAARAAEVVSVLPGVGAAPADVLRQQSAWNGDLLEVVQPIATSRGPRTALAWITLNPTTELGGRSLVIVAPAVVAAIFLAWIVAMLITRPTLRALGQLNEDVELALSGRLDGVTDPLGARPVKELADTISYLAARLRTSGLDVAVERGRRGPFMTGDTGPRSAHVPGTPASAGTHVNALGAGAPGDRASGGSGASAPPPAAGSAARQAAGRGPATAAPAPSGSAGSAAQSAAAAAASGARTPSGGTEPAGILIVDTAFRVTHADPLCATLLGVRPDALVGRHLLDAITERHIVDAVLGCLSALPASGAREATATDGRGRAIAVNVGRTGKDQPVTVTLRALEARNA